MPIDTCLDTKVKRKKNLNVLCIVLPYKKTSLLSRVLRRTLVFNLVGLDFVNFSNMFECCKGHLRNSTKLTLPFSENEGTRKQGQYLETI